MSNQYDPITEDRALRTRINSLEEGLARVQTKVAGLITAISLAAGAVFIEVASKFIN